MRGYDVMRPLEIDMDGHRHMALLWALTKIQCMSRMEDFHIMIALALGSFARLILAFLFFRAIFATTKSIGGWTLSEVIVLVGTFELIASIAWATYMRGGLRKLSRYIERGELDWLLVKPMSLRTYFLADNLDPFSNMARLGAAVGVIAYGIRDLRGGIAIPAYLILLACAVVIHYAFWCLLASLAFWFPSEQYSELANQMDRLGRYPISIYRGFTRWMLTIIIPVACIYSFPARIFSGRLTMTEFATMISVALFFWFMATFVWNAGLRHYESTG